MAKLASAVSPSLWVVWHSPMGWPLGDLLNHYGRNGPELASDHMARAVDYDISRLPDQSRPVAMLGKCNSTHTVLYTAARVNLSLDRAADLHVWHSHNHHQPDIPTILQPGRHVFFSMEPPSHLKFTQVDGFVGQVSYRRDAAIWRPYLAPLRLWRRSACRGPRPPLIRGISLAWDTFVQWV